MKHYIKLDKQITFTALDGSVKTLINKIMKITIKINWIIRNIQKEEH